jgi:DMSO/TMAO reductase YedYZ molybdopterin-dependent catalytic subunit
MKENPQDRTNKEISMRQAGRLPPGQSLSRRFPVLHYGPVADGNLDEWDFRIWGEVEEPLCLKWAEFNQLPRTSLVMDIHCVTRWSVFDAAWEGVALRTLMESGLLRIKPEAAFILQHAEYGFTVNLPLATALQENFLLATHYNDAPLTADHGFPLRGVIGHIPGREDLKTPYFWKGAKWLRGLEFLREDKPGFWEQAGYHNDADIWKEERFG